MADIIGKGKWAHFETAYFGQCIVDIFFRGQALFHNFNGFAIEWSGNSVYDKARGIFSQYWYLFPSLHQALDFISKSLTGLNGRNNLYKRHQRGRIEEVDAYKALRLL